MNRWQRFSYEHPVVGGIVTAPVWFVIGLSKFDDWRGAAVATVITVPVTIGLLVYQRRKFPTIEAAEAHVEAALRERAQKKAERVERKARRRRSS